MLLIFNYNAQSRLAAPLTQILHQYQKAKNPDFYIPETLLTSLLFD
uniref:Uncharacterized protein n=1 Tax=Gloeothece verrucosa (strain PCC 7822) TaxID=497965 RepID=E0UBG1_GLOV7|nr:hypothetical protein Cyan7822_0767 [Gloeothece verrucosa PCC 7822]